MKLLPPHPKSTYMKHLGYKMRTPQWAAKCDFQQCGILTSVHSDEPVKPLFKLRNFKWCSVNSLTPIKYIATSKGSDQTARMRRLVWTVAGHTYHIVGNLMPRLSFKTSAKVSRDQVNCFSNFLNTVWPTCILTINLSSLIIITPHEWGSQQSDSIICSHQNRN